jgi:hypothetical protein
MRAEAIEKRLKESVGRISAEEYDQLRRRVGELRAKRGTRDCWVLIGETYVEGIMHGQAVDEIEKASGFQRLLFV